MIASPLGAQPVYSTASSIATDGQPEFQPVGDFQSVSNPNARVIGESIEETDPGTYIIQLSVAVLANYRGGIDGLAATFAPQRGQIKLDVNIPESVTYLNYLDAQQDDFIRTMVDILGRLNLDIKFQYRYAFGGLAVVLKPEEAAQVAQMSGVRKKKREAVFLPRSCL